MKILLHRVLESSFQRNAVLHEDCVGSLEGEVVIGAEFW